MTEPVPSPPGGTTSLAVQRLARYLDGALADLLPEVTMDEVGDDGPATPGSASGSDDVQRLLSEVPPHHVAR
ncbi:MAG: hypothetical protein ACYCXA_03635 [Actinomycetes bacterium]